MTTTTTTKLSSSVPSTVVGIAQLRATNNKVTNLAEMAKKVCRLGEKNVLLRCCFNPKIAALWANRRPKRGTGRSPVGPSRGAESPASDGVSYLQAIYEKALLQDDESTLLLDDLPEAPDATTDFLVA
jgi:hypothetical protein